jgi:predicted transcriptional regulator
MQKYYRSEKPDVEEMKRLREEGLTYQEIADEVGFSASTVMYWVDPKHRRKRKEYMDGYAKEHYWKNRDYYLEYNKKYIKERYNNDEEFRERFLNHVKNWQKRNPNHHIKQYYKWKREGRCVDCGAELPEEYKYVSCVKCREAKNRRRREKYHKRKEKGLCPECGKEHDGEYTICDDCLEKHRK